VDPIKQTMGVTLEIRRNSILSADEHELLQDSLKRPPNSAAQKRIA
jgi:hypothetical protein